MKKTMYEQPLVQVIICSEVDVVTASPVDSVGSKWNEEWDNILGNGFEF